MTNGKGQRSINITVEAYNALVLMAEQEERDTERFVSLRKVATRILLEASLNENAGRVGDVVRPVLASREASPVVERAHRSRAG